MIKKKIKKKVKKIRTRCTCFSIRRLSHEATLPRLSLYPDPFSHVAIGKDSNPNSQSGRSKKKHTQPSFSPPTPSRRSPPPHRSLPLSLCPDAATADASRRVAAGALLLHAHPSRSLPLEMQGRGTLHTPIHPSSSISLLRVSRTPTCSDDRPLLAPLSGMATTTFPNSIPFFAAHNHGPRRSQPSISAAVYGGRGRRWRPLRVACDRQAVRS